MTFPGDELADRYRVQRELGRGANAVVYLAEDVKHGRLVALKMLHPELAGSVRRDRFLREIRIVAKLNHLHILPIHDSGETPESLYYVMPYVAGASLRDRLLAERQMPVADALRITREVASALAYAHEQGVVHRDVKPENILLINGEAVVTDFGIARALAESGSAGATQLGIAVGTPDYMSPEQASASARIDGRSDVYALGCVLYEMLAGHPPFTGGSTQEVLSRHALDPVPRLAAARAGVPQYIESAITTALAKSPADRFATASDFNAALTNQAPAPVADFPRTGAAATAARWLTSPLRWALPVFLLLAVGAVVVVTSRQARGEEIVRSLAVLPFNNLSASKAESEYYSDGLTEDLITALSNIDSLKVASSSRSSRFKDQRLDPAEMGKVLGVDALLEGTVRKDTAGLRVTAQLVDTRSGSILWAKDFDRSANAGLAVQQEIARAIADALRPNLATATLRADARVATRNPEAYDLYLRGRYLFNRRSAPELKQAINLFDQAIQKDSTYALAYSGLSDAHLISGFRRYTPRGPSFAKAKQAARRAIALNPNLADGHVSLARVLYDSDWDLDGAEREYQKAIALEPRHALAHDWYGLLLAVEGRHREAVREVQTAVQLEPEIASYLNHLGWIFNLGRRPQEAIPQLEKALQLAPADAGTLNNYGDALIHAGRWQEARFVLTKALPHLAHPGRVVAVEFLVGNEAEGRRLMDLVERPANPSSEARVFAYMAAGEPDKALALLSEVVPMRDFLVHFMVHPILDPLRIDPRFETLMRQSNIPDSLSNRLRDEARACKQRLTPQSTIDDLHGCSPFWLRYKRTGKA
jgi:serine/threonine protein kinase/tetratricopeptide (TPR) repeat protein